MYHKTDGLVLRETDYKDNDKLLTVLTREFGTVTVRARGIRGRNSRLRSACQLLTYSEFTLLEQNGRLIVTEAEAKEMFPELRVDIELLYLASYFSQVALTAAQENEPNEALLRLLLNCLYALTKLKTPQLLVKAAFEFRTACIAGFLPELEGCAVCGSPVPDRFNVTQGMLQCKSCNAEGAEGIRMPMAAGTLSALRFLAAAPVTKLFSFRLSLEGMKELSAITESYLCMRFECGFYTLDLYKSLFVSFT